MTIPSTMSELRVEVRRVACPSMTSVTEDKHGIRVRRRGDREQAGLVFSVEESTVYSRRPWTAVRGPITEPNEIGVLVGRVADGAFSPQPCFDCEDPTFQMDHGGDPYCGCLKDSSDG